MIKWKVGVKLSFLWGIGLISGLSYTSEAAAEQQCVSNRGQYPAVVSWYKAENIFIDNSEPWKNRLLIRTQNNNSGPCGDSIVDGSLVCKGSHVKPFKRDTLKALVAGLGGGKSCVEGSDNFAIVKCSACTEFTSVLVAVAGSVVSAALPGSGVVSILTGATNSYLDEKGKGISSGIKAIADNVDATKSTYELKKEIKRAFKIHDISDVEEAEDVIYVGTPKSLSLSGFPAGPSASEEKEKPPQDDVYRNRYTVNIDCFMSGVKNTETDDGVIVEFHTSDGIQAAPMVNGAEINCRAVGKDTAWHSGLIEGKLDKILVKTTGSDGFMIDQIKLHINNQGRLIRELHIGGGIDNDKAWCLSNDPGDAFRKDFRGHVFNKSGKCDSSVNFPVKPY